MLSLQAKVGGVSRTGLSYLDIKTAWPDFSAVNTANLSKREKQVTTGFPKDGREKCGGRKQRRESEKGAYHKRGTSGTVSSSGVFSVVVVWVTRFTASRKTVEFRNHYGNEDCFAAEQICEILIHKNKNGHLSSLNFGTKFPFLKKSVIIALSSSSIHLFPPKRYSFLLQTRY